MKIWPGPDVRIFQISRLPGLTDFLDKPKIGKLPEEPQVGGGEYGTDAKVEFQADTSVGSRLQNMQLLPNFSG